MADAIPGTIASSAEYNKVIDNVEDVDKRLLECWAGRIVNTAGTLVTTSGTTEINIPHLAMDTTKSLLAGQVYRFNLTASLNPSINGDQFLFRIRVTTPVTGPLLMELRHNVNIATYTDTATFSVPFMPGSTLSNAKIYVSAVRNAGTGTMSVFGNGVTAFSVDHYGSDASMWTLT